MVNFYTHTPRTISDWHPADVVAALRKCGWSLRRLSVEHGYVATALKLALHKPWPKAERLIADALGVHPAVIWPTRYDTSGMPNRQLGRPKKDMPTDKHSKGDPDCNVKHRRVA